MPDRVMDNHRDSGHRGADDRRDAVDDVDSVLVDGYEYPITRNIVWDKFPVPKCAVCGEKFPTVMNIGQDYAMRWYCREHWQAMRAESV